MKKFKKSLVYSKKMIYPAKFCGFCKCSIPTDNPIYMYSSIPFCSHHCRYLYMDNEENFKKEQQEIYEFNELNKEIGFIFKNGYESAIIELVKMDKKKSNKIKKYISKESLVKLDEVQNKIIDDLITLEIEGHIFDEKRMIILSEYKKYDSSYLSKMNYYIEPLWYSIFPCSF